MSLNEAWKALDSLEGDSLRGKTEIHQEQPLQQEYTSFLVCVLIRRSSQHVYITD